MNQSDIEEISKYKKDDESLDDFCERIKKGLIQAQEQKERAKKINTLFQEIRDLLKKNGVTNYSIDTISSTPFEKHFSVEFGLPL